ESFPELDARLMTALQQNRKEHGWGLTYLQSELLEDVFAQLQQQHWDERVGQKWLRGYRVMQVSVLAAGLLLSLFVLRPAEWSAAALARMEAERERARHFGEWQVVVEPGDAELERGGSLIITGRFPQRLPERVELVAQDGEQEIRIPLSKSLDDPIFGGRLAA